MNPSGKLRELLANDDLSGFFESATHFVYRLGDHQCRDIFIQLKRAFSKLKNDEITGVLLNNEKDVSRSRLTKSALDFISTYIAPNDSTLNSPEQEIEITIEDLKKSLERTLQLNGIEELLFVSEELIKDSKIKNSLQDLKTIKDKLEYEKNERFRYSFSRDEKETGNKDEFQESVKGQKKLQESLLKVRNEAAKVIQSLDAENDLEPEWKRTAVKIDRQFRAKTNNTSRTLLLSPLDVIQIPNYLKGHGTDYLRYKRMMIQAQDAYISQNYDLSYQLFLEVRNDIDPESAQLYEYLLTSYYRKHGRDGLIDELFEPEKGTTSNNQIRQPKKSNVKTQLANGKVVRATSFSSEAIELETIKKEDTTDPLLPLYLYANRFNTLQSKYSEEKGSKKGYPGSDLLARPSEIIHSHSGKINIQNIAQELLAKLLQKYAQLVYEKKSGRVKQQVDVQKLRKCISTTNEIYRHFQPDELLFKTIIPELLGGGYGFWIDIDELGRTVNHSKDFDAIGHFREMLNIVISEKVIDRQHSELLTKKTPSSATKREVEHEVKLDIARAVLANLVVKYHRLESVFNANVKADVTPLIQLLTSFRVAETLLPGTGLFYKLPIMELSGKASKADWFELRRGRQLVSRFVNENDTFPALAYFRYFLGLRDQVEGTFLEAMANEELIRFQYQRLKMKTSKIYDLLPDTGPYEVNKAVITRVSSVKQCFENWQICFDVEEDEDFLELCYQELVGNRKFFWWSIGPHGLHANPAHLQSEGYLDARHELNWLTEQCGFGSKEAAHEEVITNYFTRVVTPQTKDIRTTVTQQLNPAREHYVTILHFVEKLLHLCTKFGIIDLFADYIYKELVEEKTFAWLDIDHEGFLNEERPTRHQLDSLPLLESAMAIFYENPRFAKSHLLDMTSLNRLKDIEHSYYYDFERFQPRNYYDNEVVLLASIIERLIDYHRITGNRELLKIPDIELVKGNGKIKWAIRWFMIDFGPWLLKDQMGKVKGIRWRWPGLIIGRTWPRARVKKVAHFDYQAIYFYVRYHYNDDAKVVELRNSQPPKTQWMEN